MKIIGDYHTHTDNSDGKNTVEEMICAAQAAGLTEVAITDHGHGKWVGGVKPRNYAMLKALIEKAGAECGIKTYFGIEANFCGTDGQIEVRPEDRSSIDILNCGFHRSVRPANLRSLFRFLIPNWFWWAIHWTPKGRIKKNTEIVKRAVEKNDIDIWTHPNLFFKVDVVEAARTCAERGTLIELNGARISFRPIDFERMLGVGAKFIINSDAHSVKRVGAVDRVYEFLKSCDFKESDIVNLTEPFKKIEKKKIAEEDKQEENSIEEQKSENNELHTRNKKRAEHKGD